MPELADLSKLSRRSKSESSSLERKRRNGITEWSLSPLFLRFFFSSSLPPATNLEIDSHPCPSLLFFFLASPRVHTRNYGGKGFYSLSSRVLKVIIKMCMFEDKPAKKPKRHTSPLYPINNTEEKNPQRVLFCRKKSFSINRQRESFIVERS